MNIMKITLPIARAHFGHLGQIDMLYIDMATKHFIEMSRVIIY